MKITISNKTRRNKLFACKATIGLVHASSGFEANDLTKFEGHSGECYSDVKQLNEVGVVKSCET